MKTEKEIKEIVTDILVQILGVDESEVTDNANLQNDLGMDSLDAVELIMEFEKQYNISISDYDAEKISSVKDIVNYLIERKV